MLIPGHTRKRLEMVISKSVYHSIPAETVATDWR